MSIHHDARIPDTKKKSPDSPPNLSRVHIWSAESRPIILTATTWASQLIACSIMLFFFSSSISPVPGPTITGVTTKDKITKQAVCSAAALNLCFLQTPFTSVFFFFLQERLIFSIRYLPHLYFHFRILNIAFSERALLIRRNKLAHFQQQLCSVVIIILCLPPHEIQAVHAFILLLLIKLSLLMVYSWYFSLPFLKGLTLIVVDKFQTPKFTCPNLHQSACPCQDMFCFNHDGFSST